MLQIKPESNEDNPARAIRSAAWWPGSGAAAIRRSGGWPANSVTAYSRFQEPCRATT